MSAFIAAHGGVMAVAVLAVALFNVLMSAIAKICALLSVQEPAWMQKAGSVGLTLSQWLTANTPTPGANAGPSESKPQ